MPCETVESLPAYEYIRAMLTSVEAAQKTDRALHIEPNDHSEYVEAKRLSDAGPSYSSSGTFLDERLGLRDPEGSTFINRVLEEIDRVEKRKKAIRAADLTNRKILLRTLMANAFRCFYHRAPSSVAFLRKASAYSDKPIWLSGKALERTTDLLAEADLLKLKIGFGTPNGSGRASTFDVTHKLVSIAFESGVTEQSLTKEVRFENLVQLVTSKKSGKKPISFEPTDETLEWASRLQRFNEFLRCQELKVTEFEDGWKAWLECLNSDGQLKGMPYYRPETFATDLFRKFNNGEPNCASFLEGGRLYGGWWQSAPKEVRRTIQINGKPTLELDYSSHHLRMLYNQRGLNPDGDLYRLEAIVEFERDQGEDIGTYRPGIKAHTQALINCGPNGRPWTCELEESERVPAGWDRRKIVNMIEERHKPISDVFKTGAGLRLQRLDSDLALDVVMTLMEEGVVSLPVHDSFIVNEDNGDRLHSLMEELYFNRFGFKPLIDKKP